MSQVTGQVNILKNPDFESGLIPYNNSCAQGVEDGLVTDWITIPAYGYDKSSGTYKVYPYVNPSSVAVYDTKANDCYYYYDNYSNLRLCGNAQCPRSRKIPNTEGGYRNTPNGSSRMIKIGCGQSQTMACDIPQRYAATGNLTTTLSSGCIYTVRLKASLIVENYCCAKGFPHNSRLADWLKDNPFTKLVITLRKNGSPTIFKEYHTGLHVNSSDWNELEYQLTLCETDAAVGYNQIEFRLEDIPTAIYSINGKSSSLYAKMAFIDDVKVLTDQYSTPNIVISNSTISNPITWNSNAKVKLSGTIYIDADVNINGAFVYLDRNAKIIVKNGKHLNVNNGAQLESQCGMWEGITVENGGRITVLNSYLSDALTAIKVNGQNTFYKIESSVFKRCVNSLELFNTDMVHTNSSVLNNTFDGRQPLKNPCVTNAKSRRGVIVKNGLKENIITIGGTNGTNLFIGLYNGISIQAASVTSFGNRFEVCQDGMNMKYCVSGEFIEVNGNNEFIENKNGIVAITCHTLNLSVFGSLFRSNTIGILVQASQGVKFFAGSDIASQGNYFSNNEVSIKLANNGKTEQNKEKKKELYGITLYDIRQNTFYYSPKGTSIQLIELFKSVDPVFEKINIFNNKFTNTGTALKSTNIRGNRGNYVNYNSQDYFVNHRSISNFFTVFGGNQVQYNCSLNPASMGVYNENCYGMQVSGNNFNSSRTYDWRNTGVHIQDCNNTLVQDNLFNRNGMGLHLRNYNVESNYYCNRFEYNVHGIDMLSHVLRDNSNDLLHGYIGLPNNKTRDNYHKGKAAWGCDMLFGYSNPKFNQWLFQFKPPIILIKNQLGQTDNRIVDPQTGILDCESNKRSDDVNKGRDQLPNGFLSYESDSLKGAHLFAHKYQLETELAVLDSGIGSVDMEIAELIRAENAFNYGQYDSAIDILNQISPNDVFKSNYKMALSLVFSTRPDDSTVLELDSLDLETARRLASMDALEGGLGVYIARALVQIQTKEDIRDPVDTRNKLYGQIVVDSHCQDSMNDIPICLVDEDGYMYWESLTYTDQEGKFMIYPGILYSLDTNKYYGFIVPFESKFSVSSTNFKILKEWIGNEALVQMDVLNAGNNSQPMLYNTQLIGPDGFGSIFEARSVQRNFQSDVQVQKLGPSTWVKHYASIQQMNDSVFAITTDSIGNVYATGMSQDSFSSKCLVIKWNAHGDQEWVRLISDSLGRPIKGKGITVKNNSVFVQCEGSNFSLYFCINTCQNTNDNGYNTYTDVYDQKVLKTSDTVIRKGHLLMYPNPSHGKIVFELIYTEGGKLEIYNITGVVLGKFDLQEGFNKIETLLPSGLCFYKLILKDQSIETGVIQILDEN